MRMRRSRPHTTALAGLALTLLALTGCGGTGGGDDGVASANGGNGRAAASPSARPSLDPRDAQLKFAQCMRQNGVDMADPKPGEPGVRITGGKGELSKVEAARKKCAHHLQAGGIGQGATDPKARDRQLKFAQCMRQHGINVPDPKPGQPLTIDRPKGSPEQFEEAEKACAQFGPRGVGPGGAPGAGGK
jgi:hypothetical protein